MYVTPSQYISLGVVTEQSIVSCLLPQPPECLQLTGGGGGGGGGL
jgi:hypothetical protein